eukprot:394237-Amorphochlora_amoeboformis.AAC.1
MLSFDVSKIVSARAFRSTLTRVLFVVGSVNSAVRFVGRGFGIIPRDGPPSLPKSSKPHRERNLRPLESLPICLMV